MKFLNMVRLNSFLNAKIVGLWEQNQPIKKIARDMGISRNTVRRWIARYQATGDVRCDRQGPRPIAYTDESERHRRIVQVHSDEPFKTTRSSAETFRVSLSTVRRHLHAANIHNYKPAKKIQLSDDHRTSRVNFANQYLNFDWENEIVIFIDEKCFKSDKDGRKILWRRSGRRFNPKNVLDLRTSGRLTLGLDPARPLVSSYGSSQYRLTQHDAHVVQVIHTNAGFLGETGLIGHADFCVNGGRTQPGCQGHFMRIARCSHFMSSCYFAASVRQNRSIRMVGVPCDSNCPKDRGRWGIRLDRRAVRIGEATPDTCRGMYCVSLDHEEACPFD